MIDAKIAAIHHFPQVSSSFHWHIPETHVMKSEHSLPGEKSPYQEVYVQQRRKLYKAKAPKKKLLNIVKPWPDRSSLQVRLEAGAAVPMVPMVPIVPMVAAAEATVPDMLYVGQSEDSEDHVATILV